MRNIMTNTLTATPEEVISYNEMAVNTNLSAISQRIPLAKSYIDNELNNVYDPDLYGCENEYLAAIKTYVFYMYIDRPSFIGLVGVGQLKENTVDKVYMTPYDIQKKQDKLLVEVNGYLNTIKKAMEAVDTELLDISENIQTIGGAVFCIGCGGNKDYKTNYGLGMQQDDEDLREVLPDVE